MEEKGYTLKLSVGNKGSEKCKYTKIYQKIESDLPRIGETFYVPSEILEFHLRHDFGNQFYKVCEVKHRLEKEKSKLVSKTTVEANTDEVRF